MEQGIKLTMQGMRLADQGTSSSLRAISIRPDWWRANEMVVIRHLTRRSETRYSSCDKALLDPFSFRTAGFRIHRMSLVIQDAFIHLPHLRGRLTPAHKSAVRITREALAIYDERARQAGYPANWRHSDQKIEQSWRIFFSDRKKPSDLWVFGYGSLMWDPGFVFAEVRL